LREFLQDAEKLIITVTPAKAGVQKSLIKLDSCFRRNDDVRPKRTFSATAIKSLPTSLFQREATPGGDGRIFSGLAECQGWEINSVNLPYGG
jgi:hypothetical protein